VTHELELILSTDVAAGDTLKVSAAAGAGKSTALRMYSAQRPQLQTLYLTFTTAEADAKAADYARRGFHHVTVSTLHALAFSATTDLHGGQVAESLSLSAAYSAFSKLAPQLRSSTARHGGGGGRRCTVASAASALQPPTAATRIVWPIDFRHRTTAKMPPRACERRSRKRALS